MLIYLFVKTFCNKLQCLFIKLSFCKILMISLNAYPLTSLVKILMMSSNAYLFDFYELIFMMSLIAYLFLFCKLIISSNAYLFGALKAITISLNAYP